MKSTGQAAISARIGQSVEAGSHPENSGPTSPTLSHRDADRPDPSLDIQRESEMSTIVEATREAMDILDEAARAARVAGNADAYARAAHAADLLADQIAPWGKLGDPETY